MESKKRWKNNKKNVAVKMIRRKVEKINKETEKREMKKKIHQELERQRSNPHSMNEDRKEEKKK